MSLGLGALDLAPSTFYCLKMNKKRLFYVAVSTLVSQHGMAQPRVQGGSGARWAFSPAVSHALWLSLRPASPAGSGAADCAWRQCVQSPDG